MFLSILCLFQDYLYLRKLKFELNFHPPPSCWAVTVAKVSVAGVSVVDISVVPIRVVDVVWVSGIFVPKESISKLSGNYI